MRFPECVGGANRFCETRGRENNEGRPAEIQLTVGDRSAGFDQQSALSGRGWGLISMRERIHLVKKKKSFL